MNGHSRHRYFQVDNFFKELCNLTFITLERKIQCGKLKKYNEEAKLFSIQNRKFSTTALVSFFSAQ